jgi:hypothetical protein
VEIVVELAFVDELGVFRIDALSLDCHLEVRLGVDGLKDLPEGPLAYLLDDFEVFANFLKFLHLGK